MVRELQKQQFLTLIPTWEELVVPGQIRMTLQDENDQ